MRVFAPGLRDFGEVLSIASARGQRITLTAYSLGGMVAVVVGGGIHRRVREVVEPARRRGAGVRRRLRSPSRGERTAILLIGGAKAGNERWYDTHVPTADRLYDEHLDELRREGLTDG